jgi:lysine-specific demethylase 3
MYIALATTDEEGSKGSTRLHMDMADGVNIMVHAEPRADGSPGVAAWDLFRTEDADRLRRFLKRRFGANGQHDPILSQQYYLDAALRKELCDDYGIKSHRVYQRPGEAVFIPAGCAHQVCMRGVLSGDINECDGLYLGCELGRCDQGFCRLCQPQQYCTM